MKALIYDLELTDLDLKISTYDLKNHIKYFNPKCIERDWTMLGASWLWLDEDTPTTVAVNPKHPFNDSEITHQTHKALSQADMLIGHNSDNFDYKKFNVRAIKHGLPPLSPKLSIDTLKMARKYFKFTSNKLSYLCEFLDIALKDESPDWNKIKDGDAEEIERMREYNGQDCIATKALYLKLRSFHHTHPSMNNPKVRDIEGELVNVCPKCSSPESIKRGAKHYPSGRSRQQFQCKGCFGYWTTDLIR